MPQKPIDNTTGKITGRSRRMRTRRGVRLADAIAQRLITIGGIGTIVAVLGVFIFLLGVAAPLFRSGSTGPVQTRQITWEDSDPIHLAINEYRTLGWALYNSGLLVSFRLDTGATLQQQQLVSGKQITSVSVAPATATTQGEMASVALGLSDGTLQLGKIGFATQFRQLDDVPSELATLDEGAVAQLEEFLAQKTPQGQLRLQKLEARLDEPVSLGDAAIVLVDHIPPAQNDMTATLGSRPYRFAALDAAGRVQFGELNSEKNPFTRKISLKKQAENLPEPRLAGKPLRLMIAGVGDNLYLLSDSGDCVRYDVRQPKQAAIVERQMLLRDGAERLTTCELLLGRETIVCGDTQGNVDAWFRARVPGGGDTADSFRLQRVHVLPKADATPTSLTSSQRSRMICAGYDDGSVRVFQVTTEQLVAQTRTGEGAPIYHTQITPKDDSLVAMSAGRIWTWDLDPAHPETTLQSLFLPVWYEGYDQPIHMWQSTSGTGGPEPKLGLWPLIFGTIKATLYTMLLGAPLALAAAVYTSEFMSPAARSRVKPSIEMMASLPSVVLGFLAALVFAPIVERTVPLVFGLFVTIPFTLLLFSYLFQLLPTTLMVRWQHHRFWGTLAALPIAFLLASAMAPLVERYLFAGNVMRWLDGQIGSGAGAWFLLLLPMSALATVLLVSLLANPWLRKATVNSTRGTFALANLFKFLAAAAICLLAAGALSLLLNWLGWDPRGTYVDTYQQRNALVVGFVMGFAVIPIIYTIADDALSTVPQHLRSASLGCGATTWQTTQRVILPTAMSGIFSALMIGMGRAVGETMIVLMAGGNTPITEWNIFNGFRTLSANIAVELPEAARDSTHYRTLFLAALTLFVLTFIINTIAEFVRLRFRRRAYQL